MKAACIVVVCLVGIGCSVSRETTRSVEPPDYTSSDRNDNTNALASPLEPRKHKPYHDLFLLERKSGFSTVYINPLHGIAFMGGLQSLVGFVAIKIKVVLVALTIIGVVALACKIFGFFKYTGYLYKNDYPVVGPPHEYYGYHGPPHGHDNHGNDWSSYSEHYGRSENRRSETATPSPFTKSVNMTEIVYSFVNANRDDCRARLVCEFEIMLMRSAFFDYLTRHGIVRRRLPETGSHREDCTAHYTKCVEASSRRTTV